MYAVIESGGKQYRVELGSEIEVATLSAEPGATVDFDRVLLVADGSEASIGLPLVAEAKVTGSVVRHGRSDKIVVFKYQPKARRRVKHGHRQDHTLVRISDIVLGGRSAARDADQERAEQERARSQAAQAAEKQAAADKALADRLAREAAETESAKSGETKPKRSRATAESTPGDEPAAKKKASGARTKSTATTGSSAKKPAAKDAAEPKKASAAGGRSRKVQAPAPAEEKPSRRRTKDSDTDSKGTR